LSTAPQPQPGRRLSSVDFVKGVAITLVVLGHVIQGLGHRHIWGGSAYYDLQRFIYSFHMPAFFFVSGLFVQQSIAKRGGGKFLAEKSRTILYPYVLWAIFIIALTPIISRFQSFPLAISGKYLLGVLLGEYSWFLYTLFFLMVLALITRRIPGYLLFVLSIPLSYFAPDTGFGAVNAIMMYFVFVVAGQLVGQKISSINRISPWIAAPVSLAVFALMFWTVSGEGIEATPKILFIPLGLAGTAALFLLARVVLDTAPERWFAWIGEAAIGIFLLHPYFQGAGRLVLTRVYHGTAVLPQILVPTLTAILLPALLYHFRKPLHIGFLFEFPRKSDSKKSSLQVQEVPAQQL